MSENIVQTSTLVSAYMHATLSSASGAFVNTPEPSSLAEAALAGTLLFAARPRRRH